MFLIFFPRFYYDFVAYGIWSSKEADFFWWKSICNAHFVVILLLPIVESTTKSFQHFAWLIFQMRLHLSSYSTIMILVVSKLYFFLLPILKAKRKEKPIKPKRMKSKSKKQTFLSSIEKWNFFSLFFVFLSIDVTISRLKLTTFSSSLFKASMRMKAIKRLHATVTTTIDRGKKEKYLS